MARQTEACQKESRILQGENNIGKVTHSGNFQSRNNSGRKSKQRYRQSDQQTSNERQDDGGESCTRCGLERHCGKTCPAIKSKCRKCNKDGHWDRGCPSGNIKRVGEDVTENVSVNPGVNEDYYDNYFLKSVRINKINKIKSDKYYAHIYVPELKRKLDFYLDTGADVTCIPAKFIPSKLLKTVSKVNNPIRGPDSKILNVIGVLPINLKYNGKYLLNDAYIVKDAN